MKDFMIYGAGGLGLETACLIRKINEKTPRWNLLGFIDDNKEKGNFHPYGPVLGGIDVLNRHASPVDVAMAIAVPSTVKNIVGRIKNRNVEFPNIVSPDIRFYDERSIRWGRGNIVAPECLISLDVAFGDFNILNVGVIVGHGAQLGSFNCLMPSIKISGDVRIGDENFFGVNSVVLQGVRIGHQTRIGAGSVVIQKTRDASLYVGNPAERVWGIRH